MVSFYIDFDVDVDWIEWYYIEIMLMKVYEFYYVVIFYCISNGICFIFMFGKVYNIGLYCRLVGGEVEKVLWVV